MEHFKKFYKSDFVQMRTFWVNAETAENRLNSFVWE